jgi:hypothetical protein
MKTTPPNHNKRWTASDDAKLTMMWAHGVSYNDIAEFLGRTSEAVQWRVKSLNLRDMSNDELARETGPVLPGENGEFVAVGTKADLPPRKDSDNVNRKTGKPALPKRIPIEMVERRFLWGLIEVVRWKYASTHNMTFHAYKSAENGFPPSVEIVAP